MTTTLLPRTDWLARLRSVMVLRPGQRVAHVPGIGVRASRRAVSAGGAAWTPVSATTNGGKLPSGWWKIDSIVGLIDGDKIASIVDSSGNGKDASQPVESSRAQYYSNVINGYPVLRNKIDSSMNISTTTVGSIFAVCKFTSGGNYNSVFGFYGQQSLRLLNGSAWYHQNSSDFGSRATLRINGVQSYAATVNAWKVISDVTWGTPPTTAWTLCDTTYSRGWIGDVAEVIAYEEKLNAFDMTEVENYLMTRYGIS